MAYHSLLTPRRQALHEAIGATIEDIYNARLEEHCEILAHHFTRSGHRAKAVHYLSLAGKRAVRILPPSKPSPSSRKPSGASMGLVDSEVQQRKAVEILFDLEID